MRQKQCLEEQVREEDPSFVFHRLVSLLPAYCLVRELKPYSSSTFSVIRQIQKSKKGLFALHQQTQRSFASHSQATTKKA